MVRRGDQRGKLKLAHDDTFIRVVLSVSANHNINRPSGSYLLLHQDDSLMKRSHANHSGKCAVTAQWLLNLAYFADVPAGYDVDVAVAVKMHRTTSICTAIQVFAVTGAVAANDCPNRAYQQQPKDRTSEHRENRAFNHLPASLF
jgi:hypothetical protein